MPRQPRGPTSSSETQLQVLREELDTANKKVDRYVQLVASLSEELDNLRRSICHTCKSRFVPSYARIPTTSPNHAGSRHRIANRQRQSASPPTNAGGSSNTSIPLRPIVQQNQTNSTIRLVPPQTSSSAIPRQPSTAPAVEIQSQQPVSHNPEIKQGLHVDLVKTSTFTTAVRCVKFSPDGKYLAVGLGWGSGKTYIYDVGKGSNICCLVDLYLKDLDQPIVWCVQFSPDSKYIAIASGQQTRVWEIARKRTRAAFSTGPLSLCFSPNGRFFIGGQGGNVRIFSLRDGSSKTLLGEYTTIFSVAWSPDGRHIASTDVANCLNLWDTRTGELLDRWNGVTSNGGLVAFTPDGKALVTGGKTLRYWDISLADMNVGRDRVIGGTPGNRFQQIRIFECQTLLRVLTTYVSPDYHWVATGLEDNSLQIWDLQTAEWQCTLIGHAHVRTVDFSPCGKYLVSGEGHQVTLWKYRKF